MTLSPSTPLKLGAWVFAVLWTAWMIWWSGSFDRVNIVMLSICGAAVGYFWYRRHALVFPPRTHDSGRGNSW